LAFRRHQSAALHPLHRQHLMMNARAQGGGRGAGGGGTVALSKGGCGNELALTCGMDPDGLGIPSGLSSSDGGR